MERWRAAWRQIAAALPITGLDALRTALVQDDLRLVRGINCYADPDDPNQMGGACAIGFPLWRNLETLGACVKDIEGEVDDFFAIIDDLCPDWYDFVGFFDNDDDMEGDANFDITRAKLLPEVNRELARRHSGQVSTERSVSVVLK